MRLKLYRHADLTALITGALNNTNLCETGATTAALQLPVTDAADSWVETWLADDVAGALAAGTVPATVRLAASATVNLLTPLTTSDSVLLSTTNESPTAAAFDCQQTSSKCTSLHYHHTWHTAAVLITAFDCQQTSSKCTSLHYHHTRHTAAVLITQHRSIVKNVGCFQRRLFMCFSTR